MANNLIGRFYFKLTDSKNLIGEFSNNHETCKRNYTESADRDQQKPGDDKFVFVGEYFTTWHDYIDNKHGSGLAKLEIKRKSGCENIFLLTWWLMENNKTGVDPSFWGEGMLCDGVLIGDYRDFPTP